MMICPTPEITSAQLSTRISRKQVGTSIKAASWGVMEKVIRNHPNVPGDPYRSGE